MMPATLRSADDLASAGLIGHERLDVLREVAARYAVSLTPTVADLIDASDPQDPIARQFIPDPRELMSTEEENTDPIGDQPHSPLPGIVHRYPDRVLLKPLHLCPVYCRFCFRREVVGPNGQGMLTAEELSCALAYIRERPEIWEVIVTGGDPLLLSSRRLRKIMQELGAIEHVKVVRIHTRIPVVDPVRVNAALVGSLRAGGKAVYVALHANHPRELTAAARRACARLVDAGIPMLSQTVLLRGVNDDADTLAALMRAFVETRVKPYYLHHGDLAPGTAHFRTNVAEGQRLMRSLRGRVSGLCQPSYVLDIPGGYGKSPIGPSYLQTAMSSDGNRRHIVEDFNGMRHEYPPRAASQVEDGTQP